MRDTAASLAVEPIAARRHPWIGTNAENPFVRYGATLSGFQFQSFAAVADDFF